MCPTVGPPPREASIRQVRAGKEVGAGSGIGWLARDTAFLTIHERWLLGYRPARLTLTRYPAPRVPPAWSGRATPSEPKTCLLKLPKLAKFVILSVQLGLSLQRGRAVSVGDK